METTVYLVNVSQKTRTLHLPIGIGYLAKSLSMHGIPFEIIDLVPVPYEQREDKFRGILASVREPSLFGFSIIAGNGHIIEAEKYSTMVKEAEPRHMVVFGGPLPSAIPRLCLERTAADYVMQGEGEESFPFFLKNRQRGELAKIDGLAYTRADGSIIVNKKKRVRNLDLYNPLPYELFNMGFYVQYLNQTNRCFEISGSRGCRGNCKFCFRFSGPGLTSRSGRSLFDEVKYIYGTYGINRFNFTDENFLQQKESFQEFLDLLGAEDIRIEFRGQTRVDEITHAFCNSLVNKGLISINFGVESADDAILKSISKGISIRDIEEKIGLMRSYGIEIYASIIIGFPWETVDTIKATKDFILRNRLEGHCTINYLAPLPATKLYEEALRRKLIVDEWDYIRNMGYLYRDKTINMTSLGRDAIGQYYEELFLLGEPATPKVTCEYTGILEDAYILGESKPCL